MTGPFGTWKGKQHMMGYGYGYGGWWMWLGGFLILAAIAAIVYALVVIVGRSGKNPSHPSYEEQRNNSGNALGILSERYAKGEVNDEEYQQKKNALKNL
jgi:putative membrane protein